MPARIYALAKELNLDSKELVDLVKKVGITGKGSALASLSDEEAQRVRDHLTKSTATQPPPAATASPGVSGAVRDAVVPAKRKPRTISVGRSPSRKAAAEPPTVEADTAPVTELPEDPVDLSTVKVESDEVEREPVPVAPVVVSESAVSESAVSESAAAESAVSESATSDAAVAPPRKPGLASRIANRMGARKSGGGASVDTKAPIRRGGGGLGGNKVRSLDRPIGKSSSTSEKKDEGSKARRREPRINVKMAALPEVSGKPTAQPGSKEPKAQKPDVKLSPDAIAGHRKGMSAPLAQLAKEDEEKKRGRRGGLAGFADKGSEEEDKKKKKNVSGGMASARAERSRGKARGKLGFDSRQDRSRSNWRSPGSRRRKGVNSAAPRKEAVAVELPCSVRSFSEAAGVGVGQMLGTMMQMGLTGIHVNSQLDFEAAKLIAAELDLSIQLKESETLEESLITEIEDRQDETESLIPRAPIVTFLGHVDHGKTSLLDYLIGINVVSGEAGGITQHIRAYEIEKDGRTVTFVDTPGHEAFTEMRARGANVTDIAVLVIAADDGIMPQTEEAISHAKAAEVPIVVALNKIDLEGVDQNRALTQLTEHELTPSEWGGDVEVVRTSATTGAGMDELLETLLGIAELNEYTANPNRQALGVCLESEQQGDRGVVAKLIVQNGTLNIGDVVVCGPSHGRVRAMSNTLTGEAVKTAGPSTPVSVMGFDQAPGAGDRFHVLDNISKAREIAQTRAEMSSQESLSGITTKVTFENFQEMLQEGRLGQQDEKVKLNLIIRADVKGSLEAIRKELTKLDHPEVEIKVLQQSVGGVTLADVTLASASDAVIAAFNVIPDEQARSLADDRNVEIRRYNVIYKLTDEIKAMIEGRLKPEERVVELGRAVVKQVFSISRVGTIAGCYVAQGSIQRGCRIRIHRDGRTIGDYQLDTLRRIKEDVKEVPRGMECGIRLQGFNDIKPDDVLEAYKIEEVARTLD